MTEVATTNGASRPPDVPHEVDQAALAHARGVAQMRVKSEWLEDELNKAHARIEQYKLTNEELRATIERLTLENGTLSLKLTRVMTLVESMGNTMTLFEQDMKSIANSGQTG